MKTRSFLARRAGGTSQLCHANLELLEPRWLLSKPSPSVGGELEAATKPVVERMVHASIFAGQQELRAGAAIASGKSVSGDPTALNHQKDGKAPGSAPEILGAPTPRGADPRTYSTDVEVIIPDNTTVSSIITVPDSFIIADLDLELNITHTFVNDLFVSLIAPDGTRIDLIDHVQVPDADFVGTILDDEAPAPIDLGTAPFTGLHWPIMPLEDIDGMDAAGEWRLEITDSFDLDTGTLDSWSLIFTEAPDDPLEPQPYGVSPGAYQIFQFGEITEFHGEDNYAIDLTAGQVISAAVLTPGAGGGRFANNTEIAIPDDGSAVVSEITIARNTVIEDLDVKILIDHSWDEDLVMTLIAPDGTRIELTSNNGGSGDFFFFTTFNDQAPASIIDGRAPFGGHHQPESPLDVVNGMTVAGDWGLEIVDQVAGDDGALLYWEIILNGGVNSIVRLFGPQGQVAQNYDAIPGVNDAAFVAATIPETGTYYLQVDAQNFDIGQYRLDVGIFDPTVPMEVSDVTNLDPLRGANNGNASVLGIGDGLTGEDIFTVTLAAGEKVIISASTPGGFYDPRIHIDGPNGFTIEDDDSGFFVDAFLGLVAPEAGVYTITVDYPSPNEFLDAVSTGSYLLSIANDDHANNRANATPLAIPSTNVPGNIELPIEFDVFVAALTEGTRYRFQTTLGTLVDSVIAIFDETQFLDENDDFDNTTASRLDFTAPATGNYYIVVSSALVNDFGTYFLSATLPESIPPTATLVAPTAGALLTSTPAFVDITWADLGGSGLDASTIDAADITIAGLTVSGVQDMGGGTWRYNLTGTLPDGAASIVLAAGAVADLAGNVNAGAVYTFFVNTTSIQGTSGDDIFYLRVDGSNLTVDSTDPPAGLPTYSFPLSSVTSLTINALAGNDQVIVDHAGGAIFAAGGLTYNPAEGSDSLTIKAGTTTLDAALLGGAERLALAEGANSIIAGQPLLELESLAISANSQLDIDQSQLIIHSTAAERIAVRDRINGLVATGYANGDWNGRGIVSTRVRTTPARTLAPVLNDNGAGAPLWGTFAGVAVDTDDIAVGYTVIGDFNLDFQNSIADFLQLASFFGKLVGAIYQEGDSNFDFAISIADFLRMAGNFGAVLSGSAAVQAADSPSPNNKGSQLFNSETKIKRNQRLRHHRHQVGRGAGDLRR